MTTGAYTRPTYMAGRCHCGNLSVRFRSTRGPAELGSRGCSCNFCHPRRLSWTSDPEGQADIVIENEAQLSRYRFGTHTAQFLICRVCGSLVAAVADGDTPLAVINVDILERSAEFGPSEQRHHQGENVEDRIARRRHTWTPVRVFVHPPVDAGQG